MSYLIIYTMKGCTFCGTFKKRIDEEGINFIERDIDKFENEYNLFKKIVKNSLVPAFLIVNDKMNDIHAFAPQRDYNTIEEAVEIIKLNLSSDKAD